MKPKKRNNTQLLGLIAIIILLILVIVIWKPFSGESNEKGPTIKDSGNTTSLSNTNTAGTTPTHPVAQTSSSDGTIKSNDMCKDYFMKQGNTLTLNGHKIKVVKIGSNAVNMDIDGTQFLLAEGKFTWINGMGFEIQNNMLLYFEQDDPNNSIQVRVGCKNGEDPNDKYVRDKGVAICTSLYNSCKSQFGI